VGEITISDAHLVDVKSQKYGVTVLNENDHLLRRFGQIDYVELKAGEKAAIYRSEADEVWSVVAGEAQIELKDQRERSPTRGVVEVVDMSGITPQALLVPFGVACQIQSENGGKLIRISTHEDDVSSEDQIL